MSEMKKVREFYPVGSQVSVVAKVATTFKDEPDNSLIRLETSIYNKGSIARNDLNESLRTTAKTFYNYKSFVQRQSTTTAEDVVVVSNYYLPEFELRKDLFRIREAKSEEEKIKILERLVFYPHVNRVNFPDFVGYLQNHNKQVSLVVQWEERVKEFNSKQNSY
jgi:hypothetical protein